MTTKMHQCIEMYRDVMEGLIDNAVRINKEMGMLFYQDKQGNCTIGDICTGEQCSIRMIRRHKSKPIGSFHVHQVEYGSSDLSVADVYVNIKERHVFSCVGSKYDGIKCYTVLNSPESHEFYDMYTKLLSHVNNNMSRSFDKVVKLLRGLYSSLPTFPHYGDDIEEILNLNIDIQLTLDEFIRMYDSIMVNMKNILVNKDTRSPIFRRMCKEMVNDMMFYSNTLNEVKDFYYTNVSKILIEHNL